MEPRGLMGGVYRLCEWIMRLAYLNLLWIFFTIAGFIVFGIFPSTAAMFAVTRKWVLGEREVSVFRVFWGTYKADFFKSNLLGVMLSASGIILLMDLKYFHSQEGFFFQVLTLVVLSVSFLYLVVMIYIFPVYVHYELRYSEMLKNSLLIGITRPIQTLGLILGCAAILAAGLYFSQLLFFFGGSAISLLLMTYAYHAFSNIEKQKANQRAAEELTVF